MRLAIPLAGLAALALALGWGGAAGAQPFPATPDTVNVAPGTNTLFNAITLDTQNGQAGGPRTNPNRVYRLQRGGRYFQLTSLSGNFPITVVAARPTAAAPNSAPPIIQPLNSPDGSFPETIANTTGNQTWRGVYFLGPTPTGSTSFYLLRSSGAATVTLDNVTTEYISGIVCQFDGAGGSFFARDSRFRNGVNTSQIYVGRVVVFAARGTETVPSARQVVFENNTITTLGGFIVQAVRGGTAVEIEQFRFNHNTVYGVGLYPFLGEQWTDALLTNNLFVNALVYGERAAEQVGQDPGTPPLLYGVFNLNTLRTGQTTAEANRRVGVIANLNYRDPRFDAYYASTPAGANKVEGEPFFNTRTQNLFNARASFVVDMLSQGVDPGFTAPPTNTPLIIQFARDIRSSPVPAVPTNYAYDPDGSANTVSWPLSENLMYSNTTLQAAGIGGFPLGDLNWYPARKAAWTSAGGAATDYTAANTRINNEAFTTRSAFAEAESVTLTGATNALASGERPPSDAGASGGRYVYMEDSGTITWRFSVPAAGSYSLRIRYQIPFDEKAQDLTINGTAIPPNRAGRSGFFFGGPVGVFQNVDIPVTLVAGENTFVVTKNFGYMYFDSFEALALTTAGEADPSDASFQVSRTFPNPTTGRAQVMVSLAEAAQVSVRVYDLLGRQVLAVAETAMAAGANQSVAVDGSALPGGTYVYRVEARQGGLLKTATGRMTVVR